MAWISIHQQIRDHRKIRDLFRKLNISRQESVGILVLLWTWAIDNCMPDGKLLSTTKEDIAKAAYWEDKPEKLYNALIESGWIEEHDGSIYLHDWYEFNKPFYDYIDRKNKDKERKQKQNSAGKSTEIPQEFHDSPAPAPAPAPAHNINKIIKELFYTYTDDEKLRSALNDFNDMRKNIKKPMTQRAVELLLNNLNKLSSDDETKIKILEQSIVNNWANIYELKNKERKAVMF